MYSRNSSPAYVQAVHEAFQSWIGSRFGNQVVTSTPCKPPRPPPGQELAAVAVAAATKRPRSSASLFPLGVSDDDASPGNIIKSKPRLG